MREHSIDIVNGCAGKSNEVVADTEKRFAYDFDVVLEEEVEVLKHGTGEAVFNGNDRGVD